MKEEIKNNQEKLSTSPVMNEPQVSGISHHNHHHLKFCLSFENLLLWFYFIFAKLISVVVDGILYLSTTESCLVFIHLNSSKLLQNYIIFPSLLASFHSSNLFLFYFAILLLIDDVLCIWWSLQIGLHVDITISCTRMLTHTAKFSFFLICIFSILFLL